MVSEYPTIGHGAQSISKWAIKEKGNKKKWIHWFTSAWGTTGWMKEKERIKEGIKKVELLSGEIISRV